MQKGETLIIVLFILAVIGFVGVFFYLSKQYSILMPQKQPIPSSSNIPNETADWKIYTNKEYNLSFKFPPTWTVEPEVQQKVFRVVIKSPSQLNIAFSSGLSGAGGKCNDVLNTDLGHESISIFNTPFNIFYKGDKKKDLINFAYVIKGDAPCSNIAFFDIPTVKGLGSIGIYYGDVKEKSIIEFKSTDLDIAKQVLTTFKTFN